MYNFIKVNDQFIVLQITLIAGLIEGEKLALNNREYPRWANYLAWGLYASCFALVPLKALHEILLQPGTLGQVKLFSHNF